MATRLWQRISLLIGMLGLLGHAGVRADEVDATSFQTEEAARAYLDQNPYGPRAKAAFLALVQFDLARKNPDFSLDEIRAGFARAARAGTRPPRTTGGTATGTAGTTSTGTTGNTGITGSGNALPY